jgi:hypothetical protein
MNIDEKLREILDYMGESFYPEHEYGASHAVQNKEYLEEALAQIKQVFADEGYVFLTTVQQDLKGQPGTLEGVTIHSINGISNIMTGQEWYDRFFAEYHNKADWIEADESMGEDAGHDVLLCAKLAAGIE